ncbi:hypothetical protein ANN_25805 [Periplaneta americana]|uniref:C-type lectin domain-containing protein n=1 Tax=Periplaneta americana TaxID=6978 RepID=A0ABQ8S4J4_PERAM|nr:hypothetical protein ANN_25805 [Periplaneta americana]
MAGLCEGGNELPGDNAGEMSPGSNTESYPAFAHIALRENPGKNLNQITCPDRDSNPGHLVSRPDALTVTPQRDRSGRPSTGRNGENIAKIKSANDEDRRKTIDEVSEQMNLSWSTVQRILTEDLHMRRVSAKFVPRLLTDDQRENRVRVCRDLKSEVQNDPNFLKRIVTGDESWCYGYDPESKQASSQWKTSNSPRPKKARQVRSNVKTMLIYFFDVNGIVHKEFVPPGQTVNQHFYLDVLRRLRESVRRKLYEMWRNGNWLLHHDNAPAHTALTVRQFLTNNMVLVPHPPYSPDLAPDVDDVKENTLAALNSIPANRDYKEWTLSEFSCVLFLCAQRLVPLSSARANSLLAPYDVFAYEEEFLYYVYDLKAAWMEACTICKDQGMHLAEILVPDEAIFLSTVLDDAGGISLDEFWIGGEWKDDNWSWTTSDVPLESDVIEVPPWINALIDEDDKTEIKRDCLAALINQNDALEYIGQNCQHAKPFVTCHRGHLQSSESRSRAIERTLERQKRADKPTLERQLRANNTNLERQKRSANITEREMRAAN